MHHDDYFRGNTVLTFDIENKGAVVLEHMRDLNESIQRWLEKNLQYIDFVVPLENSLTTDPVQAMFCGRIELMQVALKILAESGLQNDITVLRTEPGTRSLHCRCPESGMLEGSRAKTLGRLRGIPREEVMAIGDNYNDIEMLAFAGQPFIMGNASEELRGKGWAVTTANDQNGVAAAIEQVLGARVEV